jgi:hypothetical protein
MMATSTPTMPPTGSARSPKACPLSATASDATASAACHAGAIGGSFGARNMAGSVRGFDRARLRRGHRHS